MRIDLYTKVILTVIALSLGTIALKDISPIKTALADESYIIETILYCLDGSRISDGRFSTYCNG